MYSYFYVGYIFLQYYLVYSERIKSNLMGHHRKIQSSLLTCVV